MDILELHEFFVEGKDQKNSHVLLHITEPSTPEEQKKGYFFAVAEIENGSIEIIERVQQMIDDLESGYYETSDEGGTEALEITLEYINRRSHHLLEYKKSHIHCLVGAIRENEISFAYHGDIKAFVLYKSKQGYTKINLIEEKNEEQDKSPKKQLFSEFMQGNIQAEDYFFVSTPYVYEYLSDDRLQKIITSRSTRQSVNHIQKVLANLRSGKSFGGILFRLIQKNQLPKTGRMPSHLKRGSADSLNKLINAQHDTDETLHPPLFSNTSKVIKSYFSGKSEEEEEPKEEEQKNKRKINKVISLPNQQDLKNETNYRPRTEQKRAEKERLASVILIGLGKTLFMIGQFLFLIIKRIIIILKDIFIVLFIIITDKAGQRQAVINQIKYSLRQRKDSVMSLPLLSKILLLATVAFAIIFISSILFIKAKEAREARQLVYLNLVAAVTDKKDAAEASMVYGDDTKAFELLKEAEKNISQLSRESKEEKTKADELAVEVEKSLMKLRKIKIVPPEIVSDVAKFRPEANTSNLAAIDEKLIIYGDNDNYLYVIDQDTGTVDARQHTAIPNLLAASTPKEHDMIVFLAANNTIAQLDKNSFTLSTKDISFPQSGTTANGIFIYNRRIYTLDPKTNQVYKHNPTQTGYDRGSAWIKTAGANLEGAVSLAVDGDIFVLKQNGEILKFVSGDKQNFVVSGLDPALENPAAIWTYNDVLNIYILEPKNKRVVVLNKEGKLLQQYTAAEWQNPTGMVVDEIGGIVYVLDENKVYKFSI
ncbi:MAG: hypothetical protein WC862_04815 [Patescibacteria group bacterium]